MNLPKGVDKVSIHPTLSDYGDFVVFGWGVYEEGSVLHGQERRVWLGSYDTVNGALQDWPDAYVSEWTAHRPDNRLPLTPESWFDPADAGEAWGEEDY